MSTPYTSLEHDDNLHAWMAATDKERSEAFWHLHSICGARAEIGDDTMAEHLRELMEKLRAGEL